MNFIAVVSPRKLRRCLSPRALTSKGRRLAKASWRGQGQHRAHVVAAGVGEAAEQEAVGGQPKPGAGAAERLALVGAEGEKAPARHFEAHGSGVSGGVGGGVIVPSADERQNLLHANEVLLELLAAAQMPHVHQLDEAQLDAALKAVVQHGQNLIRIAQALGHHVHLHLEPSLPHPLYAQQHRVQIPAAGDGAERIGVQGIQADVDAAQAGMNDQVRLSR